MSADKRRRGQPAAADPKDLGLLEIARAIGRSEGGDSALPPGKRDPSGFWYPAAYEGPMEMFTPRQRTMQERQRIIQRDRLGPGAQEDLQISADAESREPLPLPAPHADDAGSRLQMPSAPSRQVASQVASQDAARTSR